MQRLFFHLHECGSMTHDEEGREPVSAPVMREMAMEAAREVMCSEVREGRLCLSCHIEVLDEHGQQHLLLPFDEAIAITGPRK
jgi:hypothetical protein